MYTHPSPGPSTSGIVVRDDLNDELVVSLDVILPEGGAVGVYHAASDYPPLRGVVVTDVLGGPPVVSISDDSSREVWLKEGQLVRVCPLFP